jgi:hypothetical protein
VVVGTRDYQPSSRGGALPVFASVSHDDGASETSRFVVVVDAVRSISRKEGNMPLVISLLSSRARERYLAIGRRYASGDTLAQAHKTLAAHDKYGALILPYGWGMGDAGRLGEARDQLHARKVDHNQATNDRRVVRTSRTTARRDARSERLCSRSVLTLALGTLIEDDELAAADRVEAALEQTSADPDDDQGLVEQLDTLGGVLADPLVAKAIEDRGGEAIARRRTDAHTALMSSMRQRGATPEISAVADERDILDGIIVSLARAARNASRIAARHLGQPAIEVAFRLTHLSRSGSDPELDTPELPEEPATEPVTQ